MTQILPINPDAPEPGILAAAADVLQGGGLVAYPTETVYGLAASAFIIDTLARVFDATNRSYSHGLPVQVAATGEIATLARDIPRAAGPLIDAFFPGPLTLIFLRLPTVSLTLTGGQNTIAVRMPDHPVPLGVIRAFGAPVVCPMASLSGRRPPRRAADVLEDLDGAVDLILDGGETGDRPLSTVLDVTVVPAILRREGAISRAELEPYLAIAP